MIFLNFVFLFFSGTCRQCRYSDPFLFLFRRGGGNSPRLEKIIKKKCAAVLIQILRFYSFNMCNNSARSFVFNKHLIIFRGPFLGFIFFFLFNFYFMIQVVLDGRIKRAFRSALVATSASAFSENSSSIRQPKSQQPQQRCAQVREVVR